MFDFVRNHNRILQLVLVFAIVPSFVFLGIESYSSFKGRGQPIAEVAGSVVSQVEYEQAYRHQIDRLRAKMPGVDAAIFDRPEFKQQVLEELIRDKILTQAAKIQHLAPSDTRLQRLFAADPQMAYFRNSDGSANAQALEAQGMTSAQLADRLRQAYASQQVLNGISETAFALPAISDLNLNAWLQEREFQSLQFKAKDFGVNVAVNDETLKKYFEDPLHQSKWMSPESADIQYVILDASAARALVQVSEEDLKKYYTENTSRYSVPEERHARHILIKAQLSDTPEVRQKAKEKAEKIVQEARQNSTHFVDLARKNSEDSGSAQNGGDLGFFRQDGSMVKPFEAAVFSLKKGEISSVVETEFGFHIIQLIDIREGQVKTFDEAKSQIKKEVEEQSVKQKYNELAEQFTNAVYEQSDSLQSVAEKMNLKIQTASKVLHQPLQDDQSKQLPSLTNPKFLGLLFSPESIQKQRNTEAIEIGPQTMISARITQYAAAKQRAFDEVKEEVRTAVVAEQAVALMQKSTEEKLAQAKQINRLDGLGVAQVVSRIQHEGISAQILHAVLAADIRSMPAWIGVKDNVNTYTIIRVNKVISPPGTQKKELQENYARAWGQAQEQAYFAALREKAKVKEFSDFSATSTN
jgi:peptidyl-prolyl cis-trans isomerase D